MLILRADGIQKQEHVAGLPTLKVWGVLLRSALRTECTTGKPWCKPLQVCAAFG